MHILTRLVVPVLALTLLSACASNRGPSNAPVYSPSRSAASSDAVAYGIVRSIETVGAPNDQPRGAGAVVGGLIGAVIGRQFADSNSGKNVGTVAGAVGGALIGNEIEKNSRPEQTVVRVNVQLDRGGMRSFDYQSIGDIRVGDRVRIEGNLVYRL